MSLVATGAPFGPGALLGVLGGGQLGAMFAAAARRLGYRVAVWDPDPQAPAHRGAERSIMLPFGQAEGAADFLDGLSAATYEWENVPAVLCESIERRVPLFPASGVLRTIQHRGVQKAFLARQGFPVAPYRDIRTVGELDGASAVGFPCLVKTATAGYDGKGQWRLQRAEDVQALRDSWSGRSMEGRAWIVEAVVPFVRELSVVVVRGQHGDWALYPVADNRHERGILRRTAVPAPLPPAVSAQAQQLSQAVVRAFDSPGVFCVELFLLPDGQLLVNEVAPRPHNSGHYTLDACPVSQFEQQVRVLCGLPLGPVELQQPAAMVNLLGDDVRALTESPAVRALVAEPGVHVHLYGKPQVRPGRKMGHVTVRRSSREAAESCADALVAALGPVVTL